MTRTKSYAKMIYVLMALTLLLSMAIVGIPMAATVEADGTLLSEGFEGSFPPPGWTIVQYSGNGTWEQEAYGVDYFEPPGTGNYYAEADSDEHPLDYFDTGLFTPSIDCCGCGNVSLIFARNFQDMATFGYAEVNTYSGGTGPANFEENLWFQTTDDPTGGVHTTLYFDPSGYAEPSNVYIEFYYDSEDLYAWKFAIDDVVVVGEGEVPVGGEAFPVNQVAILGPWIAVAALLAGGISWYALRRRRAHS